MSCIDILETKTSYINKTKLPTMGKGKFEPLDIKFGQKSVSCSDVLARQARQEQCDEYGEYDPHTVEHATYIAAGCSQCKLVIHSRRMCNQRYCNNVNCCSSAISVHCRKEDYNETITFPFAVQFVIKVSLVHVRCRYCGQDIMTANTLDSIVGNKHIIEKQIRQHQQNDKKKQRAIAFASGTTQKFGEKSPVSILDMYIVKKIFSLL